MRRRARDYASRASWVPGENISVVQRGGVKGSHTLNAAGMQMFVNCVSNLGRLPTKTLQELYNSLTGNKKVSHVAAVTVAAMLAGVHTKTARQWSATLTPKNWPAAFTPGNARSSEQLATQGQS